VAGRGADSCITSNPEFSANHHTAAAPGVVRGACLIGAIGYERDAPLTGGAVTSCHCTRCRRAREARHIFVSSRAPWFEIADELPQFAEYSLLPRAVARA